MWHPKPLATLQASAHFAVGFAATPAQAFVPALRRRTHQHRQQRSDPLMGVMQVGTRTVDDDVQTAREAFPRLQPDAIAQTVTAPREQEQPVSEAQLELGLAQGDVVLAASRRRTGDVAMQKHHAGVIGKPRPRIVDERILADA